ncbi:MAG: hypothetical protein JWN04_3859, partial [Myxococcaceae bacterium]|nr:hypothetical protein [Myxococcaceae bacterium]
TSMIRSMSIAQHRRSQCTRESTDRFRSVRATTTEPFRPADADDVETAVRTGVNWYRVQRRGAMPVQMERAVVALAKGALKQAGAKRKQKPRRT